MKILGLITSLGIDSSLGIAWKTKSCAISKVPYSYLLKTEVVPVGLEYPLPLFYVVIFWILLYPIYVNYTQKQT